MTVTVLVRHQLARLAAVFADLKVRVRLAVAGELATAVGGAVWQVVAAVVTGRGDVPPPAVPRRRPPDRWDDGDDGWDDDCEGYESARGRVTPPAPPPPDPPRVAAAVAAGAHAARWWLARSGTLMAAAGLGLGVGLLGALGGPAARAAVAVLAAADLLADALGTASARLDPD